MSRKCPGDGLGANPGTSGTSRPDLCVIPHRLDRTSAGQTGHSTGTKIRVSDAAFLLTVGSFLLTVELFHLHFTI